MDLANAVPKKFVPDSALHLLVSEIINIGDVEVRLHYIVVWPIYHKYKCVDKYEARYCDRACSSM